MLKSPARETFASRKVEKLGPNPLSAAALARYGVPLKVEVSWNRFKLDALTRFVENDYLHNTRFMSFCL